MSPMPLGYDSRLIRYICAIADTGSISSAAQRLSVSQPTLTRQLGNLERSLGVALFERSPNGVRTTRAGELFLSRGRSILRSAESLDEEMRAVAQGHAGRLRLGFVGSAINGPLAPGIVRLRTEVPQIDLDLREAFDDRVLTEAVRSGDLDLAVHRLPTRDPALTSIPWTRESLSVFFPDNHPLSSDTAPLPLSALRSLDLVMWPRDSAPQAYDEVAGLYQRAGCAPRVVATAHTVQAILALVACRIGVAIMSESYRALRRVGVRNRTLDGYRASHYITVTNRPRPALVERAVAVMTAPAGSSV
jgi:LysR family transcriptional regulator, benzoate and cis,cis-muconate-responsive activator of ben and cat genes